MGIPGHMQHTILGEGKDALAAMLLELIKQQLVWRVELDGDTWTIHVDGGAY